jgi:hypothetical protein
MTFWPWVPLLFAWQLELPPAVEAWQRDIEAKIAAPIRIIEVPSPRLSAEEQLLLEPYFANPAFQQALARAQALTLSLRRGDSLRPFVFLNLEQLARSPNNPVMLLAHEFGHLWLQANGFFPPKFNGPFAPCLAIHTGDIVQHEFIRAEMDRRALPWRTGYQLDYEAALAAARLDSKVPAGDPCLRAQRLSLMMDLRLGFPAAHHEWRNEYLRLLGAQDPDAEAVSIELSESFRGNYAEDLRLAENAVLGLVARRLD